MISENSQWAVRGAWGATNTTLPIEMRPGEACVGEWRRNIQAEDIIAKWYKQKDQKYVNPSRDKSLYPSLSHTTLAALLCVTNCAKASGDYHQKSSTTATTTAARWLLKKRIEKWWKMNDVCAVFMWLEVFSVFRPAHCMCVCMCIVYVRTYIISNNPVNEDSEREEPISSVQT